MSLFDIFCAIQPSIPLLTQGVVMTIRIWILSALFSLSLGCCFGIIRCNRIRIPVLAQLLDVITFMFRGIPFYIQLLIAYFVIPELCGLSLSACSAAALSLGLCSAAYVSQMVRGGINATPAGQWDAAHALGYTRIQTLRFVVIPQVMCMIIPMLIGELDQLLKSTSIVSAIGVLELTRVGMNIISCDMNPVPVYISIALIYLAISSGLAFVLYGIERRLYACR